MTNNNDAPRLRVVGSGDSTAVNFWNSGYLLEADGQRVLIDCGFTIKYALRDLDLTLEDVDAVIVTHVHGDHVHGLERLGYESRYGYGKRARLLLPPGIRHELWDLCLRGTMGSSGEGGNELEDFFDVTEIEGEHFRYAGLELRLFKTPHVPGKGSYGLIINDRLIVTSDTRALGWLAEDDSERVIIHDCALAEFNPVHASLGELLESYPPAVRRRMWLIHYDDCIEDYRERIERNFAGVVAQGQEFAL